LNSNSFSTQLSNNAWINSKDQSVESRKAPWEGKLPGPIDVISKNSRQKYNVTDIELMLDRYKNESKDMRKGDTLVLARI